MSIVYRKSPEWVIGCQEPSRSGEHLPPQSWPWRACDSPQQSWSPELLGYAGNGAWEEEGTWPLSSALFFTLTTNHTLVSIY